jgi:short-subunit dehydrogenase
MTVTLSASRALVTGASGGIGAAIARALYARGATVIATARRESVLDELRSELGDRVEPLVADLADRAAVAELPARAGRVDVLVANAALPASGTWDDFTDEEVDRALDVNLRAPIHLARALAGPMVERGSGHLVFISSLSGKTASGGGSLYSATKFGLRGYALGMREDLVGTGVGVTTVFPGFIRDAGMFHESNTKLPPGVGTKTPDQVAQGVLRGIERNRAEVDVAPVGLRLGAMAGGLAPAAAAALQRRLGGDKVASQMAAGQRSKR